MTELGSLGETAPMDWRELRRQNSCNCHHDNPQSCQACARVQRHIYTELPESYKYVVLYTDMRRLRSGSWAGCEICFLVLDALTTSNITETTSDDLTIRVVADRNGLCLHIRDLQQDPHCDLREKSLEILREGTPQNDKNWMP
jgi:hypothetical protein